MDEDGFYHIHEGLVLLFFAILLIGIVWAFAMFKKSKNDNKKYAEQITQFQKIIGGKDLSLKDFAHLNERQKLEFQKKEADIRVEFQKWAFTEFERYKNVELEKQKKIIEANEVEKAKLQLQDWKVKHTAMIRQSAATKSYSVVLGKVTEHLLPFHPNFPFNPQDARFIGGPIDLIVFDGLTDGDKEVTIYFVEIKTGKSRFNDRQVKVMEAIKNNRIEWYPIRETDLLT